jgi:hypothetical protein
VVVVSTNNSTIRCRFAWRPAAYLKLSLKSSTVGDTFTNINVLLLPPKLRCSRYVSFELRYGMCWSLFASAPMTSPNAESDLLIACVSFSRCAALTTTSHGQQPHIKNRDSLPSCGRAVVSLSHTSPVLPLLANRSLPARSIKFNKPVATAPVAWFFPSMRSWNTL